MCGPASEQVGEPNACGYVETKRTLMNNFIEGEWWPESNHRHADFQKDPITSERTLLHPSDRRFHYSSTYLSRSLPLG